jgi:hypothetical protein
VATSSVGTLCAAKDVHVWQFVNTGPAAPPAPSPSYESGSCGGTRNYAEWYVDACPGNDQNPQGHLIPEVQTGDAGGNVVSVVMSDQPTAYTDAGTPAKKQFCDVLMCDTRVMARAGHQPQVGGVQCHRQRRARSVHATRRTRRHRAGTALPDGRDAADEAVTSSPAPVHGPARHGSVQWNGDHARS